MAPNIDVVQNIPVKTKGVGLDASASPSKKPELLRQPLKYSGALDGYRKFQVTPVIGVEYPELQLSEILKDDAKLRDLAVTGKSIEPKRYILFIVG